MSSINKGVQRKMFYGVKYAVKTGNFTQVYIERDFLSLQWSALEPYHYPTQVIAL